MRVKILYFARFRDLTKTREEYVDLPESATIADLRTLLEQRHLGLGRAMETALSAVNRDFAFPDTILKEGDEVAFFPPVSGGNTPSPTVFRLTEGALDLNALLADLVLPTTGAACVFTGVVRARTERGGPHETSSLEYEAYAPMAESKMQQVADEIRARWSQVEGIAIVQRIGQLDPGTPTVLIACTAAHRDSGIFEAARYGIDRLKEIVPVWKKEVGSSGETWVEGTYRPGAIDTQ